MPASAAIVDEIARDCIGVANALARGAIVWDARPSDAYRNGHIPGAVRFDIDAVADHSNPLPHMLPDAQQFAREVGTQMVFMDGGVIVEEGDPRELFANPQSERLQLFFSEIL